MSHLFAFHIGPVQSFIISARRSRDLWFGSWLLSELTKAAAAAIADDPNATLIFPAPKGKDELKVASSLSVANRVVAVVEGELGDLPKRVQNAVRGRLAGLAKEIFDWIEGNDRAAQSLYDRGRAEMQVEDLPELFWVAYPITEQAGGYRQARAYVEAMMAARKATREFRQPAWAAEGVPKSSLDGQRESVIDKRAYPARDASDQEKQNKADKIYRCFRARPAEQLSGVDLLKRLGNLRDDNSNSFPSTSHVASLSMLAYMRGFGKAVAGALDKYIKRLDELKIEIERVSQPHPILGRYDGSILYASRLVEEMVLNKENEEAATEALDDFLQTTVGGLRPSPYYALLVGDGDFMGSVIDAQKTEEDHRQFSQILSEFALKARQCIEKHEGALVFAGGDDVLAFLPLHTALACAEEVAGVFRAMLAGFQNAKGKPPSFSAGLVIAHHLEPLSDVMRLARAAEHQAKAVDGKDALTITLSKRGGADRTIVGKWETLYPQLTTLVVLLRDERLPSAAAYDLQSLARRLEGAEDSTDNFDKLLRHEATRILKRKRGERGRTAMSGEDSDKLLSSLKGGVTIAGLLQLSQEIVIAQLLAQAENLAYGRKATDELDRQLEGSAV